MSDSPSQAATKGKRNTLDTPLSPNSFDQSQGRSYLTLQPTLHQRKIFGFEMYVDNDILNELEPVTGWLQKLQTTHGIEHIGFNPDLTIPDLNGRNIQIYDPDMERKYHCSKALLADVYQCFKKIKRQAFSVIIFVPEGMVSLLIGARGHQINKIMKESHTTIVVNQPINRMTYRTAKIQGYHSDIAKACRIIYEMLEEKSSIAYSIEKEPSQLDYTKSKIRSKFIFSQGLVSHLERKKKRILQKAEQETRCNVRFETQRENRLLKSGEYACWMLGKLEDVEAMVVMLINMSHEYLSEDRRNVDYTLKMLIPANYVTKLIGQKGYMIRDIIERSGGAQIKILSDKQEKDRECVIAINGTKEHKIDAACFILEQIECFKNGGPILQSGKSINQNLAQQFKNSLPMRQDEDPHDPTGPSPQIEEPSEEEGLIEGDSDKEREKEKEREQAERLQRERREAIERDLERINPIKRQPSRRSPSSSSSSSRSRSRQKKHSRRGDCGRRGRSSSSSVVEYKHEREYLQLKLLVPRRLGQDHRELRYIESLGKSTLSVSEGRQSGGDYVLTVRGSVKDNSRCLQLLQKRLIRLKHSTSSSR